MRCFVLFFTIALTAAWSQQLPLDKPPQDVDEALHARIKQFYDYQVDGKYRRCEALVAAESQDDFYNMAKMQIDKYEIGSIEYFDHFTKAKAMIISDRPVLFPGVGAKIMPQPFTSFWKQVKGVWFWYYNKDEPAKTPFGTPGTTPSGSGGTAAMPDPSDPEKMLQQLQLAVKIDRNQIDLDGGTPQTIKVKSSLPGLATLTVDCPSIPIAQTGLIAAFDKKDIKGEETSTLTVSAGPRAQPGRYTLRIIVLPTMQTLDLTVNVAK